MNWKKQLTTLACSLLILNPLDAARQLDKNLQNPRTINDTASVLQEMHGQMKLMQEQLMSLKASQALLSAESAIKNLTPKVRKLEVHLERLEKQIEQTATGDELTKLKNDVYDLKSKLGALINAPEANVDATLRALNPTLDRLQKQVHYLYESNKNQVQKNIDFVEEKINQVSQRIEKCQFDVAQRFEDIQGVGSSINMIRQTLQQNSSLINGLKVDMEGLKNEKIGLISKDIQALKDQINKDKLVENIAHLKQQINKLAHVFKNSLGSIENANQQSEKTLEKINNQEHKIKFLSEIQDKHKMGLNALNKRTQGLNSQLQLFKTVFEQNVLTLDHFNTIKSVIDNTQAEMNVKYTSMESQITALASLKPEITTLDKKSQFLYQKNQDLDNRFNNFIILQTKVDDSMTDLKTKIEVLNQETKGNFQVVDNQISAIKNLEFDKKIDSLNKKCNALYLKIKNSPSKDDLNIFALTLANLESKLNNISSTDSFESMDKKSSQVALKVEALQDEIVSLTKKLQEKDELLEKLVRKVTFLTKSLQVKADQNTSSEHPDLTSFKSEIEEKVNKELKAIQNDRSIFETLIQRIAALESLINQDDKDSFFD